MLICRLGSLALVLLAPFAPSIAVAPSADPNARTVAEVQGLLARDPVNSIAWLELGRLEESQNQRLPAFLCYVRYLTLERDPSRSAIVAPRLWTLLFLGVSDENEDIVMRPPAGPKDPWWGVEFLVSTIASKRHAGKAAAMTDAQFLATAMEGRSLLMEDQLEGKNLEPFWTRFVIPYFVRARKQGYIEAMSYEVERSLGRPEVTEWLRAHDEELTKFRTWSQKWKPDN